MINKMWYVRAMEYYSALKINEILSYATTWMSLEDTMLSEIRQSQKKNTVGFHSPEFPRVVKFMQTESRAVITRY